MGLDMYLKSVNRTDHSIEELNVIDNDENVNPDNQALAAFFPLRAYEFLEGVYSIFHEVAYWRKFNALHNWFLQKVQDGVDDCNLYEIEEEHLVELLDDLNAVLKGESVDELEPIGGFFFGSTEKDNWYMEDMKSTKKLIDKLNRTFDFKTKRLFYRASW